MKRQKPSERSAVKHIESVSCDVSSCVYHDGDRLCTADRIRIGPIFAKAFTDTLCATYEPRGRHSKKSHP